jgi:hypothetical protein
MSRRWPKHVTGASVTEKVPPRSSWQDPPDFKKVKDWQQSLPDAADRILSQWEEEVRYVRKIGIRTLRYAMVIMLLTIAATVALAMLDKAIPSIFTSSGGAVGVVTTLITGRSPALIRRGRGS